MSAWEIAFAQCMNEGRPVSIFDHPLLPGGRWTINPALAGLGALANAPTVQGRAAWAWLNSPRG